MLCCFGVERNCDGLECSVGTPKTDRTKTPSQLRCAVWINGGSLEQLGVWYPDIGDLGFHMILGFFYLVVFLPLSNVSFLFGFLPSYSAIGLFFFWFLRSFLLLSKTNSPLPAFFLGFWAPPLGQRLRRILSWIFAAQILKLAPKTCFKEPERRGWGAWLAVGAKKRGSVLEPVECGRVGCFAVFSCIFWSVFEHILGCS